MAAERIVRAPSVGSTSPQRTGIFENLETATTGVLAPPGFGPATPLLVASGSLAIVAADEAGDFFPMWRLRSSNTVHMLRIDFEDLGTAPTIDLGLYSAGIFTAVDADLFTSVALAAAADSTGVSFCDFGSYGVPFDPSQRIWEALDLAADPGLLYDFGPTIVADVTTATANLSVTMFYS